MQRPADNRINTEFQEFSGVFVSGLGILEPIISDPTEQRLIGDVVHVRFAAESLIRLAMFQS